MPERKQTPQIRFKGFSDIWEQFKLSEIVNDIADGPFGSDLKSEHYTEEKEARIVQLSNIGDFGWQDENVKYTTFVHAKEISRSIVNAGNLIMAKMMPAGLTIICPNIDRMYVLSSDAVKINLKKNINSNYFVSMTKGNSFLQQIDNDAQGSTRTRTSISKIKKMDISVPQLSEQLKIGEFFTKIDNLITLHQRKYEKLLTLKKSCIEKMFPKNENKNPEIRFKRFTENWDRCKLGDIYQKIRNAFVGTATPYYVEHGHFYLESNNVKDGQINRNSEIFINEEFYQKQKDKWLQTDDIVMVQSGHVGHSAVIPPELDNTAAHALIIISNPIEKTDPHFYNYQFQSSMSKKQIANITTGNTIKHILSSDMKTFEVFTSDYSEQTKIGAFFSKLDDLIALHQRKLKMLQNIKKSCLEKMFV